MKLKWFFGAALVWLVIAVLVVPPGYALGQEVETKTRMNENSVNPPQSDETKGSSENKIFDKFQSLDKGINLSDFQKSFVPGEVIVKFKENRVDLKRTDGPARLQQFAARKNLTTKDSIRRSNLSVYKTKGEESVEQVI